VLHFRLGPEAAPTLDSLAAQTLVPERVVVVDNGSGDGSADRLCRERPDVELLEASENLGYAGGMNLGISALETASADAVLLLTHETVLEPDCLEHLARELELDPQVAVAGPLLCWRSLPEVVYSAGARFDPRTWHHFHDGHGQPRIQWRGVPSRWVHYVDGAAMLLRADAVELGGPMDEEFFMYYEETDYQLRLRRAGWAVACVPAAVGYQEPGRPLVSLWTRNRLRLLARHAPTSILIRELATLSTGIAKDMVRGRRGLARDRLDGMTAFLTGRPASSLVGSP
jgi:GT2 family glycosyltransferase